MFQISQFLRSVKAHKPFKPPKMVLLGVLFFLNFLLGGKAWRLELKVPKLPLAKKKDEQF